MASNPQPPERQLSTGSGRQRRQQQAPSPAQSRRSSVAQGAPWPGADESGDGSGDSPGQAASPRSRLATTPSASQGQFSALEGRASRVELSRRPSIRIRPSSADLGRAAPEPLTLARGDHGGHHGLRPRSNSQPSAVGRPADAADAARTPRRLPQIALPRLTEEGPRPTTAELGVAPSPISPSMSLPQPTFGGHGAPAVVVDPGTAEGRPSRLRRVGRFLWPGFGRREPAEAQTPGAAAASRRNDEYHEELVDWLDIIDPEVQTLSTLTNVQNSLFIPDLGNWVNRRPTYILSQPDLQAIRPASADSRARPPEADADETEPTPVDPDLLHPRMQRSSTITSRLTDSHYAALPHGSTIEGWSAAEKWELDDHVRHMLHSRRSRFKRTMKGFGQYVRRPLGFFVTVYATLITLFGLAWVLFLIGWIYVGEKQVYAIHIIDSVLVALFAIMGDGLAPFRAIDTYHMFFVVRYSGKLRKAAKSTRARLPRRSTLSEPRSEAMEEDPATTPTWYAPSPARQQDRALVRNGEALPPTPALPAGEGRAGQLADLDAGDAKSDSDTLGSHPLTAKQRKSLEHHQAKLAKSHSFYKPQETLTHYSFPLGHLVAIVILLDFHSCLQISLGACTWGIDYRVRPFALTTVILCVSITCNLTAGLVIMVGDRKTRKKDVIKLLNRQELTGDAMKAIEHKRKKEQEKGKEVMSDQTTDQTTVD